MQKIVLLTALLRFSLLIPPVAAQSIIHFCGEVLPANHPLISQKWAKVLSQQANQGEYLTLLKQRAEVVFPVIEPIISKYAIPADFKYLLLVESGGQNFTVSRRGAAGFWQLMPQTARSLGLNVLRHNDERYDLRKSTTAACRYIRDLYEQLGSWTLVATAYNAGPTYVQALHRRFPDKHALALPYQAAETKSYVFQAVALKELLTNPQSYADYLSAQTMARLTDSNLTITEAERLATLASLTTEPDSVLTDSLWEAEPELAEVELIPELVELASEPTKTPAAGVAAVPRLETRLLSGNGLSEGQLCVFEAVRSTKINGVTVAVGDLIYAHVELLDRGSGRVFLRTEKVVSQTQESARLNLVAVETTRQPGVSMPARDAMASGWRLNWESM